MAKEYILQKLLELKEMNFENLMTDSCNSCSTTEKGDQEIDFYFNLADDDAGGWTTKESTYKTSLKIAPFLKRNCGVVVFFASEDITPAIIKNRVEFYCNYYNSWQN